MVYRVDKKPWATNCLHSNSMSAQYMLATVLFLNSLFNEFKFTKPVYPINSRFTWWHPRWRCLFLCVPCYHGGGASAINMFFKTYLLLLTTIAKNTTNSLTNLQKSLNSLANVVFDNLWPWFICWQNKEGYDSCQHFLCTYMNTSSQV